MKMKPVFIASNDRNYRLFLKLLKKNEQAFLSKEAISIDELSECLKPFYKNLNKARVKKYGIWVRSNKEKLSWDMKKIDKLGENSIMAPDNVKKHELFTKFVKAIISFCEIPKDFEMIVKKKANLIAEKLYSPRRAKLRLTFVKRYLRSHYEDLKRQIITEMPSSINESETDSEDHAANDTNNDKSAGDVEMSSANKEDDSGYNRVLHNIVNNTLTFVPTLNDDSGYGSVSRNNIEIISLLPSFVPTLNETVQNLSLRIHTDEISNLKNTAVINGTKGETSADENEDSDVEMSSENVSSIISGNVFTR